MRDPRARLGRVRYEGRILLYGVLAPLPALLFAGLLLYFQPRQSFALWVVGGALVVLWLCSPFILRRALIRPIQTLANVLAAVREGDLSIRASGARSDDALGLAFHEVNTLGETLREQRLGAQEATALLRSVMDEIDVAVLAFDDESRVRLVNRAAERLLGHPSARMLGRRASEYDLDLFLQGDAPRTLTRSFPGGTGRWELRRAIFRQGGRPHQLVVLADVTRALREEELQAWQRLIRVLRHELYNSLAPIQSIAGSLADLLTDGDLDAEDRDDLRRGLGVIRSRSAALSRFLSEYALLAQLPAPVRAPVDVAQWVGRAAALEHRLTVEVRRGPPVTLRADEDQLDQLLINLVRNAADASLETRGGVVLTWAVIGEYLRLEILDEGPGVSDATNLFVPFFTTKVGGSGIGLALSRRIAEGHGGELVLENRDGGPGARAVLTLPLG